MIGFLNLFDVSFNCCIKITIEANKNKELKKGESKFIYSLIIKINQHN